MTNHAETRAEALETFALTMPDGAVVHVRRLGRAGGPRVFASHGNGFAAGAFRHLWAPLAEHCDVVLFDLRNHGLNPVGAIENHTWANMAADMATIAVHVDERCGAKPAAGVFHSMSGVHALRAERARPGTFAAGLVVLEPPVPLPEGHALMTEYLAFREPLLAATRDRKDRFESVDEMVERYLAKDAFAHCRTDCVRALAEAILTDDGAGGLRLRCPTAFEEKIYATNADDGLFGALAGLAPAVLNVTGTDDGFRARHARAIAEAGGMDLLEMETITHLMPLERPEDIAEAALSFLKLRH